MLIPTTTTLRTEDFISQKDWIPQLLLPLNQFLLGTSSAVNGNLTFGDNIPCQTQTLEFTYGGASDFPKTFKWNLTDKPVELRLCQALENGVGISLIPLAWGYADSKISLQTFYKVSNGAITNLTVGASYKVTVRGQP